jgi:UPF0716 protein FxsA
MRKSGVQVWLTRFALLELVVFVLVASWLGFLWALVLIIVTSSFGSYRLKSRGMPYDMQGGRAWVAQSNTKPADILCDFLWLIPGFVSSIVAFILLVPPLRKILVAVLLAWLAKHGFNFAAKQPPGAAASNSSHIHSDSAGHVVDGEFKRHDD